MTTSASRTISVSEYLAGEGGRAWSGGASDAASGILVHRLFQFSDASAALPPAEAAAFAKGLLDVEARAAFEDVDAAVARAIDAWRRMRAQPEVAALLASGRALYEVPFSLRLDDQTVVRGAIDCLVLGADGGASVLEFKTGARRAAHQRQLDIYLQAVRAWFPSARVDGRLVYPDAD